MIHLHVHGNHSFLEGTAGIRQLVARAVEYGMPALALTDTNGLYGAIPFYKAARAAGVKPILGAKLGNALLLARDRTGYAQLCQIVTAASTRETDAPFSFEPWPFPFGLEHLFLLSDDRALITPLRKQGLEPIVMLTHYGDGASRYRAAQLHGFAQRLGLRAAAVNPIYFLEPAQYAVHRVLAAIRLNTVIENIPPEHMAHPGDWFRPPALIERLYAEWPESLDASDWIAEECNLELALGTPLFPEFPLPAGETAFSWLWKKTFKGLKQRYHPLRPAIIDRVRHELDTIHTLGFAPYFLIVGDLVRFAREREIPMVGRGSAANSVVAYALGITRVDPFKYDLYFERFLNPARRDIPDIDLDICWRRRDEVIDYAYAKYGAERVAMICTINTFQARSAVREVAKAHGLTVRQIDAVAKALPHYGAKDIRAAVKHLPECHGLRFDEEPFKSVLEISEFIDGFPRHLSIHAGGLVIAPEPLTQFTPLQRAAKGILITQYDMDPIQELGLVKMDLLGHRALTVIDDTVKAVRRHRQTAFDIEAIPGADPATAALLRAGTSIGCFQIESPAMRALLQKVAAQDIHTLIQCIALVRPGASGSGMKQHFIDRRHGREAASYLHPALEKVLGDTYGVMIYQEDVLKVVHAVAGMDLAEADALRRAMSKKRGPREMAKSMKRFLDKSRENGVDENTAQAIWELIANFAAYAYCKAHAATYGELAYQCAYLKTHYPAEFFAAVLSNRGGFYAPPVYLEEAKRAGVEVRPPDVQRSRYEYTAEDDALRVGFIEVGNLSQNAVRAILEAQTAGPFTDLTEFLSRTGLTRADAELLFHVGAMDTFGAPRPAQLWQITFFYQRSSHEAASLFHEVPPTPTLPDYSDRKRHDLEWEALGFLTRSHPLHYHLPLLWERTLIASNELARYEGQSVTLAGWLIAERRLNVKDGHGVMKFLTLEDTQGTFEAVLFPEAYQRFGALLRTHGPYLVSGLVQQEHGAHALIAEGVEKLSENTFPPSFFSREKKEAKKSEEFVLSSDTLPR